jgi:hypothetical protein
VLPVTVEAYRDVVVPGEREAEPRLHSPADADVEGQAQHGGAEPFRDVGGAVGGRVVDHDDVDRGVERADLLHHPADRAGLVERRDDRGRATEAHAATPAPRPTSSSSRRARCA